MKLKLYLLIGSALLFSIIFTLASCDKDKDDDTETIGNILTASKTEVTPSEIITINGGDIKFTQELYSARIEYVDLELQSFNDSLLVFVVPDIPVGTYKLKVYYDDKTYSVNLNILSSNSKTNSTEYVQDFYIGYDNSCFKLTQLIEQMKKPEVFHLSDDRKDIEQVKSEISSLINSFINSTSDEKTRTAEFIQLNNTIFIDIDLILNDIIIELVNLSKSDETIGVKKEKTKLLMAKYIALVNKVTNETFMPLIISNIPTSVPQNIGLELSKALWKKEWKAIGIVGAAISSQQTVIDGFKTNINEINKFQKGGYEVFTATIQMRSAKSDDLQTNATWLTNYVTTYNQYLTFWHSNFSNWFLADPKFADPIIIEVKSNKADYFSINSKTEKVTAKIGSINNELLVLVTTEGITNQNFTYELVYDDTEFIFTTGEFSGTVNVDCEVVEISHSNTEVKCTNDTGASIVINAEGGIGALTYSIDNAITFVNTNIFTELPPGNYNIAVRDEANCVTRSDAIEILNPEPIRIVTQTPTKPTAYNIEDGIINIKASGGTGVLKYSIDGGATYFTSGYFNNLPSSNYRIKIKDENECSITTEDITLEGCKQIIFNNTSGDASAYQANDGWIVLSAIGGDGSIEYSIDNGETFSSNNEYENLAPGQYNAIAKDEEGCMVSLSITIKESTKATIQDDRDNKEYKILKIGSQWWMKENLNYDMNNSTCYDNKDNNCARFGKLYTYEQATEACPTGWKLPSDNDWKTLEIYLGMAQDDADATNYRGVIANKLLDNGTSEFDILKGGSYMQGYYLYVDLRSYFWTSTDAENNKIYIRSLAAGNIGINRTDMAKDSKFSIRCIEE